MISLSPAVLLRAWRRIGWFGVVLLLYLSFTPQPPEIAMEQGDKVGHALAYAVLFFWWAQLHVAARSRLRLAAGLMMLGVAIEYVQGWTGWRSFDYHDMLADLAGVSFGWLLAATTPNLYNAVGHHASRSARG